MIPLIGISSELKYEDESSFEISFAPSPYINAIASAGGLPIVIPIVRNIDVLRGIFDRLDGILLTGGEDIEPWRYAASPHQKLGLTCRERDDAEIQLAQWAYEEKKPLLAICRGCQVANVALGGTLFQDIPSEIGSRVTHSKGEGPLADRRQLHSISIIKGSLLGRILNTESIHTSSTHHQSVKKVSSKLVVAAQAEDGVIEAIEAPGAKFFLGVQGHPESLFDRENTAWLALFEAFVAAASTE